VKAKASLVSLNPATAAASGTGLMTASIIARGPSSPLSGPKAVAGKSAKSIFAAAFTPFTGTVPANYTGVTNPGGAGYIISGPPNYIEMTLTQIALTGSFSDGSAHAIAWTGSQVLKIDGVTPVDTSGITMTIPTGTVTSVGLTFANPGVINGQLTGTINTGSGTSTSVTVYTNGTYPYFSDTGLGGASSYASFTSPTISAPTDMQIDFGTSVITQCSPPLTVAVGDTPTLTLLFDLSRMLRFYDGLNTSGVNPGDSVNNAYFFAHTLFGGVNVGGVIQNVAPIAAFFGTPGSIQGYSSVYSGLGSNGTVTGWMTLVFDSASPPNILSGVQLPDDDNGPLMCKGTIGYNAPTGGLYNFNYYLGSYTFNLTGFTQQTVPGSSTPTVTFNAMPYATGVAYYTLQVVETK